MLNNKTFAITSPNIAHNNILVLRARNPFTGALVSPVRDGIAGAFFADNVKKNDITSSVAVTGSSGEANYMRWRGTDLAAAQVSGTAALILGTAPTLRLLPQNSRPDAVRAILLESARGNRGRHDERTGYGILDARAAVLLAEKLESCLVGKAGGGTPTAAHGYECIEEKL